MASAHLASARLASTRLASARLASIGVTLALIAGPVCAQPSAQPSAEARDLAIRYMAALRMDQQMVAMMNNLMPQMIDRAAKSRGVPANPELSAAVTHAAKESVRAMTPAMVEAMVPAVAETFTLDELRAAVAYYESPLGQSLIAKTPQFTAKATPAMARLMPAFEKDMQARVCKEIGCEVR